ncbi:MAG TPA: hypothetical protein VJC18_11655 [bacterium]|nr:hypothetical protein [bacterium]
MKLLSIRIDDFLLNTIQQEARNQKSTLVEVIRAALMNYFINKKDIQDVQLAESRLNEDDLPFSENF